MKVKDFMTENIIKCDIDDDVDIIAKVMSINDIGLVAIEKNKKIVGVITDRDLVIGPVAENTTSISDFISQDIISVESDSDIEEAFYLMKKYKVKRLLVTKKNKYIGIISISDLLDTDYEDTFFKTLKEIKA